MTKKPAIAERRTDIAATSMDGQRAIKARVTELLREAISILVIAWIGLCAISVLYLGYRVPLNELDLAKASWITSPTDASYLRGVLGAVFVLVGSMLALAGLISRSWTAAAVGLIVAAGAHFGTDMTHTVRMGLLNGNIKIGCYVWEMRECHEMLGLDTSSLPSRYAVKGVVEPGGLYAPWYQKRLDNLEWNRWYSWPPTAFLVAPLHIGDVDRLQALLRDQRGQVQAYMTHNAHLTRRR